MNAIALIQAIGSCALFSSRIFLPALLTAALLRWGAHIPLVGTMGLLANTTVTPIWFTSDWLLVILAVLSTLELIGDKIPEVRAITDPFQGYLKPAIAVVTSLGVISATDEQLANAILLHAGPAAPFAAVVSGVGTAAVTWLRGAVVGWIENADPDDSLHVRRMLSWGEDLWVFIGIFLLFVLPAVMLVLVAALGALLALLRRHLAAREERSKVACAACATPMFLSAPACPACATPSATPRDVGLLGQALARATPDLIVHRYKLLAHLRCPNCASRLRVGDVGQACAACQLQPFAEIVDRQRYIAYLDGKQRKVYAIVIGLSLVPVLGYVCAAVVVQLTLVAPLRVHLPLGRRWLLGWLLRLLRWTVMILQVIPGINAAAALLDSVARYRTHRRALVALLAALLGGKTANSRLTNVPSTCILTAMKLATPHWPLEEVKTLVAAGQFFVLQSRARAFFRSRPAAIQAVSTVVGALTLSEFSHSTQQMDVCDVYGVTISAKGWYFKLTIDRARPEVLVISLHPLERPLQTNGGEVLP